VGGDPSSRPSPAASGELPFPFNRPQGPRKSILKPSLPLVPLEKPAASGPPPVVHRGHLSGNQVYVFASPGFEAANQ